jgi:hypothetical protein
LNAAASAVLRLAAVAQVAMAALVGRRGAAAAAARAGQDGGGVKHSANLRRPGCTAWIAS